MDPPPPPKPPATAGTTSGIPRLSRLPLPKSATIAGGRSGLKPRPSMDSLTGRRTSGGATPSVPRPSPASRVTAPASKAPVLKTSAGQDAVFKTPLGRPGQSLVKPKVSTTSSKTARLTLRRKPESSEDLAVVGGASSGPTSRPSPRPSSRPNSRPLSLCSSEQDRSSSQMGWHENGGTGEQMVSNEPNTPSRQVDLLSKSLADRTKETIAKIPPSPANRRRRSSFFNPTSPMGPNRPASAMGEQTLSRPGTSDGKIAAVKEGVFKVPGKPASMLTTARPKASGSMTTSSLQKSSGRTTGMKSAGSSSLKASGVKTVARTANTPARKTGNIRATGLSGEEKDPILSKTVRPLGESKTVAARSSKPRASIKAMFLEANGTSTPARGVRKTAIVTPIPPKNHDGAEATPSSAAKSSAAFREQIRKAKAQRKDSLNKNTPTTTSSSAKTPFDSDFLNHQDPFNQLPKGSLSLLQTRINQAREDGRLNISAMQLKNIPEEVIYMYDFNYFRQNNPDEAEHWNGGGARLTRLVAADNEIEDLGNVVFPERNVTEEDAAAVDDFYAESPEPFGDLEHIDLHGNLLTQLPIGFESLMFLRGLNLNRNNFTTHIFTTLFHVTTLRDLRLSHNNLSGAIPDSLLSLTHLEHLELNNNNITEIPGSIGRLQNLRYLDVSHNNLRTLPMMSLSTIQSLQKLYASKNQLSGSLFPAVQLRVVLPELRILDVSANDLTSIVAPVTPDRAPMDVILPAMTTLNISFNSLLGLPECIRSWTALSELYAQENSLSALPDAFFALQTLRRVDFTANEFSRLDPRLGTLDNVEWFSVRQNPLRERRWLSMEWAEMKRALLVRLPADGESSAAEGGDTSRE